MLCDRPNQGSNPPEPLSAIVKLEMVFAWNRLPRQCYAEGHLHARVEGTVWCGVIAGCGNGSPL